MVLDFNPYKQPSPTERELRLTGEIEGLKAQITQLVILHDIDPDDPKIMSILKQINAKIDELEKVVVN